MTWGRNGLVSTVNPASASALASAACNLCKAGGKYGRRDPRHARRPPRAKGIEIHAESGLGHAHRRRSCSTGSADLVDVADEGESQVGVLR